MSSIDQSIYIKDINSDLKRLYCLLDSSEHSTEFGSFHRNFWHHKQSGFSSAIYQMGAHSMALAYKNSLNNNIFYKDQKILNLIEAALLYTIKIQKSDGSYDEWYLNERGWAGPTGYISHSMADTLKILGEEISIEVKEKVLTSLDKSASFLGEFWEEHILYNHIMMALLPIIEIYHLTGNKKHLHNFEKLLNRSKDYFYKDEGWGLEYDGPDIGYQSATISFLAKINKVHPKDELREIVDRSYDFVQHFYFPDASFANGFGSRFTSNLFVHGNEYWAKDNEIADRLALQTREGLELGKILHPCHYEDHYFIYRLPEYIDAFVDSEALKSKESFKLPWEKESLNLYYPKAEILIKKKTENYDLLNIKKGGVLQSYLTDGGDSSTNEGWWIELKSGEIFSNINSHSLESEVTEEQVFIKGYAGEVKTNVFSPLKLIIFNFVMLLFGWNKRNAYLLKSLIRKKIMFSKEKRSVSFKRTIDFKSRKVSDEIRLSTNQVIRGGTCSDFISRYVPQSHYYQESARSKRSSFSNEQLSLLNKNQTLTLESEF